MRRIAIVGTGVIGAGWAAQYLARGFEVIATDPAYDEVLKQLGFSTEEIGDLRTSGAIPHFLPPEEATAGRRR